MRSTVVAGLGEQVDALAAVPVAELSISGLQELIVGLTPVANRLTGIVARAVGELHARSGGSVPASPGLFASTSAWLREQTNVSGQHAGRDIRAATLLRDGLPAVVDAIVDGTISVAHGRVLARLVGRLDAQALLGMQPALITVAGQLDPAQLGCYVSNLIATWCEPALDADETTAQTRRYFQFRDNHDGSWSGRFNLPDAGMDTVLSVLEPLARRAGDTDDRNVGQRRADAMVDVFGLAARHGDLPDAGGHRPQVTIVIPAGWAYATGTQHDDPGWPWPAASPDQPSSPTLADLDHYGSGGGCATAAYAGPVTRNHAATLGCDADWHRLVLDHTGQAVSLSTLGERISLAQRRAVAARDRTCLARGCTRPPAFCDVHHLQSRADGGPTEVRNLVLLCRRHHTAWHRGELTIEDLRVPWLANPPPR